MNKNEKAVYDKYLEINGKPKRTRSAIGRGSRRKGHAFERWVANQLKAIFPDAHRQPQSQLTLLKKVNETLPQGQWRALTDVVAGPFAIECKHRKVLPRLESTLAQAEADSAHSGMLPIAVHKQDGDGADAIVVGIDSSTLTALGGMALICCDGVAMLSWPEFKAKAQAIADKWKAMWCRMMDDALLVDRAEVDLVVDKPKANGIVTDAG